MKNNYIEVGRITSAHGIKGEVKIKSFTENPANLLKLSLLIGKEKQPFNFKKTSINKDMIIALVDGVKDRNAAELMAGQSLYSSRETLPKPAKNEFYQSDLIGLKVRLENGKDFGQVIAFHNFGAGDLIEIKLENGKAEFFPFTKKTIREINIPAGHLVINPPEEV